MASDSHDDTPVAAKPAKLSGDARYQATGKRKSSVARVLLTPGSGKIQVNERSIEEYFPRSYLQTMAVQPLVQAGYEGNVDVSVRVHGGGHLRPGIRGPPRDREGAHRGQPRPAHRAEAPGNADPRRPRQGASQGGPQEGAKAPAVLQALEPTWSECSSAPTGSAAPSAM